MSRRESESFEDLVSRLTALLPLGNALERELLAIALAGDLRRQARLQDVPAELTAAFGDPFQPGEALRDWCRRHLRAGNWSVASAPLLLVANLLDVLAAAPRPPLVFDPRVFRVSEGHPLVHPQQLELFRPAADRSGPDERQRACYSHVLAPALLDDPLRANTHRALVISFARFVVETFLGVRGDTVANLEKALRLQNPADGPGRLLLDLLDGPPDQPSSISCRFLAETAAALRAQSPAARPPLRLVCAPDVFAYSVPGLLKEVNEDRVLWRCQDAVAVLLVSDGVSTCDLGSGEQAAEEIVRLFRVRYVPRFDRMASFLTIHCRNEPATEWEEEVTAFLSDFFDEANARVVAAQDELLSAQSEPPACPMCATLTMVVIVFDQALIASVGDSPAWSYAAGQLHALTSNDHAWRSPDYQPDVDPPDALTRVVGRGTFDVVRRRLRPQPLAVCPTWVRLNPGDLLLVASDGLVRCIDEPEEQDQVRRLTTTLQTAETEKVALPLLVQRLIRLGEDGRSDDNITLCAARIGN
jgi:serine/threonine protein phosphatase PrpC